MDRTEQAYLRDNNTELLLHGAPHLLYAGCWLNYVKGTHLQRLLHISKFGNGLPLLCRQLGRLAATEWQESGFFDPVDIIVPIPLHKRRYRERGFNQSECIARGIAEIIDRPIDTTHLTRERNNEHQARIRKTDRLANAQDLFLVNHPEEWYGRTLLLVDDILTTGATIRAAMQALKEVYGCKIVVFAVAKAR